MNGTTISTNVPYNPPTIVVPEPDTTTTTYIYAKPCTKHYSVPHPNPPPSTVTLGPDTPSHTTTTPTVVADCHGLKWYNYEDVIDIDELPSLQWNFTNKFGDPVYLNSGVWMSRFDAWLMIYDKKLLIYLTTPTWSCSGKVGSHLKILLRRCGSKVWQG